MTSSFSAFCCLLAVPALHPPFLNIGHHAGTVPKALNFLNAFPFFMDASFSFLFFRPLVIMSTAIGEGAGLNWRFKYSNHISWQGWEGIKKKNLFFIILD